MSKFIPILFSTPMVQALLEGRKTMTRRKIKLYKADENPLRQTSQWMQENNTCPYGKVGGVLWVRETHYAYGEWKKHGLTKNGKHKWRFYDLSSSTNKGYKYEDMPPEVIKKGKSIIDGYYKRPSLFMPKAACRIFLEITEIRVERLNDISERDAINEGIKGTSFFGNAPFLFKDYFNKYPFNDNCPPKFSFQTLWQSINGKDSWDTNPWVWVISFKRIDKPVNFN